MKKTFQIILKLNSLVLVLGLLMARQAACFAWGDGGHMMVAKIAFDRLNPSAQAEANRLLAIPINPASVTAKTPDFVGAAHWADDVRPLANFSQTAGFHFIDNPFTTDNTPLPADLPEKENIVKALDNYVTVLQTSSSADPDKAEALRFVIHFVGDIHQPLHCGTKVSQDFPEGDRGGNDFMIKAVNGAGKMQSVKLHSYWDGGIGTFPRMGAHFQPPPLEEVVAAAATLVQMLPDSAVAWDTGNKFDYDTWAQESFTIARDFVYQGLAESAEPSQAYNDAAIAVVQNRVVMAGYRLAGILNSVWPDQSPPVATPPALAARSRRGTPAPLPPAASNFIASASSVSPTAQAIKDHWLPDPALTPGDTLSVTSDKVCVPGYAKSVRNVTQAEKLEVYRAYGLEPGVAPCPCEVDHLISLELGGSNDKRNLWPQPYNGRWNAHQKDKLENFLHEQVCNGQITLEQAQQMISSNWIKAYTDFGLDAR